MRGVRVKLDERDPSNVEPFRYNLVVEYIPDEYRGVLVIPDTADDPKKDMKARLGFHATVVSVGSKVDKDGLVPGARVWCDESCNPWEPSRAFTWEKKHYIIIDQDSVIGSSQPEKAMVC